MIYIDIIKFYVEYSPGHGQITRWGLFQVTQEAFTSGICCNKFQKKRFEL